MFEFSLGNEIRSIHHPHTLTLTKRRSWRCDICRKHYDNQNSFCCKNCDFDLCISCKNKENKNNNGLRNSNPNNIFSQINGIISSIIGLDLNDNNININNLNNNNINNINNIDINNNINNNNNHINNNNSVIKNIHPHNLILTKNKIDFLSVFTDF